MKRNYFFNFDKLDYVRGKRPEGCILCHIVGGNKDVPDLTVYEGELIHLAVNLYPYNPGHLMVFPKRHITDIRDLSNGEWSELREVQDLAVSAIEKCYNPTGFNIGYNLGEDSGASIAHIHMHIIPRYPKELGIADILSGNRLLVENPYETRKKISDILKDK